MIVSANDKVYMYATMILHEGKQKITPDAITNVMGAAGVDDLNDNYIQHIAKTYYEIFGPNGEGWDEVVNAPAYEPHPIPLIDELLKPEEPEVVEEEPEDDDIWKNLFG